MAHVFISYSHNDKEFAAILINQIETAGFNPWVDTDELRAGKDWREGIDNAIKESFAVVVIMSPEAKASEYVTYEWAFAWGWGIRIIPVMLKTTSLHPRLEAWQYLNFTNYDANTWRPLIEHLTEANIAHAKNRTKQDSVSVIRHAESAFESDVPGEINSAISSLMKINSRTSKDILVRALHNVYPNVRLRAARACGQLGERTAIFGLTQLLEEDRETRIRAIAAEALGQIGDPLAVPALIRKLEFDEVSVVINAAWALGEIKASPAISALIAQINSYTPAVRLAVVKALGSIGGRDIVPGLITRLEDEDMLVRNEAAKILGDSFESVSISPLFETFKREESELVRRTIAASLRKLDAPNEFVTILIEIGY